MSDLILTTTGFAVGYRTPLVGPLDLRVAPGEFVCLLGRNGVGKTTLLRSLAGLSRPLAGAVAVEGDRVFALSPAERARRVAVVLTDRIDAPGLTVRDVVELGRQPYTTWSGALSDDDHHEVDAALEAVDGSHLVDRVVDALSDGERQRTMIARGLAQRPRLLLLDEITAFLDLPSRVGVMMLLRNVARARQCAIVLSSHDLELSLQLADRVWLLRGDGTLADDCPEGLALAGDLGRTFDQQQVRFSIERGQFELQGGEGLTCAVAGEGPAAFWTRRALRRIGFQVSDTDPDARLRVDTRAAPHRWDWQAGGDRRSTNTLVEMIAAIRLEHPISAAVQRTP